MADATTADSTALVPRAFGQTGLTVSALGYGAGQIGDARLPDDAVERLLNTVLDAGVTLIDTAKTTTSPTRSKAGPSVACRHR